MNEIITVRDSEIIAAEINTIKEDTRRIMIANAIRIGGKLMEAKSMVDHGEWGKWLEEKVDYSQSTANNLMQLYREYGTNQESLFDNWTNSQTFANLTYTQHMALLALPFADRAEFAETHNVEEMSTRELEKAIREELAQAKADLEESEKNLDSAVQERLDLERQLEWARSDLDDAKESVELAQGREQEAKEEAEGYRKQMAAAEKAQAAADAELEKVKKQLTDAKAREKTALDDLKKARENPDIPDSLMERMRKEMEAEVAQKATADLQKQLSTAQQAADEAARAKEAAEAAARAAEEKLAAAQKQIKMADPDIIAYQTLAKQLMDSYKILDDCRLKVAANNPDAGDRLHRFQTTMVNQWRAALEETGNA